MSTGVAERMTLEAWGDWEADPTRIHVPVSVDRALVNRYEYADVMLLLAPAMFMAMGWTLCLVNFTTSGA